MSIKNLVIIDAPQSLDENRYPEYSDISLNIGDYYEGGLEDDVLASNFDIKESRFWNYVALVSNENPNEKFVIYVEDPEYIPEYQRNQTNFYKVEVENGEIKPYYPKVIYNETPEFVITLDNKCTNSLKPF